MQKSWKESIRMNHALLAFTPLFNTLTKHVKLYCAWNECNYCWREQRACGRSERTFSSCINLVVTYRLPSQPSNSHLGVTQSHLNLQQTFICGLRFLSYPLSATMLMYAALGILHGRYVNEMLRLCSLTCVLLVNHMQKFTRRFGFARSC